MQDFTGVPAVVDLAAMRDAMACARRRPAEDQPAGSRRPRHRPLGHRRRVRHRRWPSTRNVELEYERNRERYKFLKWGQQAFAQLPRRAARHRHLPPGQSRIPRPDGVDRRRTSDGDIDRLSGHAASAPTRHTTMVNGLGVLGWGVGGIEAEAAMLGQPVSMLIPGGDRLPPDRRAQGRRDRHRPGAHGHADAAQEGRRGQVRRVLRARPLQHDAGRPRHHRQHGARVRRHLRLLPGRRRDASTISTMSGARKFRIALVEAYSKAQGLFRTKGSPAIRYSPTRSNSTSRRVVPSMAGPKRPEGRIALPRRQPPGFSDRAGDRIQEAGRGRRSAPRSKAMATNSSHGDGVIAAITSCTNTSNPSVLIAAGLLARNAAEKGLRAKPWVKTSLAPGSQVVAAYLEEGGPADLSRQGRLQSCRLRLHHLHRQLGAAAGAGDLEVDQRQRPGRRRRAVRQPQLRRPRQPGRAGELPRLAAAGRRLCAGRAR